MGLPSSFASLSGGLPLYVPGRVWLLGSLGHEVVALVTYRLEMWVWQREPLALDCPDVGDRSKFAGSTGL